MGDKGNQGSVGMTGIQGDSGDKGSIGFPGIEGNQGIVGKPGPVGQKGEVGITGSIGEKGETGMSGQKGIKGMKGLQGQAGSKGENGEQGQKGQKGERGLPGPSGDKGNPGLPGSSGVVTDSDCFCLEKMSGRMVTSQTPINNLPVTTNSPPTRVSKHITYNVTVGSKVTFHCDNKSSDVPWSMIGQPLNDRVVTSGADLVIPELYRTDAGTYSCVTQTDGGITRTQTFTLNVKGGSSYDCDFEANLCRWIQSNSDQMDWSRASYGTSSSQTGPRNRFKFRRSNRSKSSLDSSISLAASSSVVTWSHLR
ncbi:hypothetical protein KUTeg_014819 [Tegillarca granosa]|uniref:Ig-like domain-containing protein n=1 Tax=Tegillarca granosa TaxID=220873 RepID=A0ABQ9EQY2_TEGGR|nr:hypothetical protein KUTeg_014819 [Tegillarca granosa]